MTARGGPRLLRFGPSSFLWRYTTRRYSSKGAGASCSSKVSKNSLTAGGRDSKNASSCSKTSSSEPWTTRTFSQSSATTSFLSAITRSKPLPHDTRSFVAGTWSTMIMSSPSPAERMSFEASSTGPSTSQSPPSPPTIRSAPRAPSTKSLPSPPITLSGPLSPWTKSLPEPPNALSEPRPP